MRKYDLIANDIALTYKSRVKTIPYVMTWVLVAKYHKKYRNEIGISSTNEAYIQSLVLEKTLESISFERKRGIEEENGQTEVDELVNRIITTSREIDSVETQ